MRTRLRSLRTFRHPAGSWVAREPLLSPGLQLEDLRPVASAQPAEDIEPGIDEQPDRQDDLDDGELDERLIDESEDANRDGDDDEDWDDEEDWDEEEDDDWDDDDEDDDRDRKPRRFRRDEW